MVRRMLMVFVVLVLVSDVNAGIFNWRRARCSNGSCGTASAVQKETAVQKEAVQKEAVQKEAVQKSVVVTQGSPLYGICLRKARLQAARGRVFHPGGSMGSCHYEGCGSGSTAAQALANCCFTGKRRCAASAVVRGANGRYYATKLFW